ncbi:MAG TPA: dihydrodipicolinate synthase family protein [Propionibacteriaceae bacterium]|nr:dihydrodipicolinate synthase family protein [Propionibacteriaceae bacterium]
MTFPDRVWPTMLTTFTRDGEVDHAALAELTRWYIDNGSSGLFALCQSSEIFTLSPGEKLGVLQTVLRAAAGQVPVIASGHTSWAPSEQIRELTAVADLGPAALILISNRLATADEPDSVFLDRLSAIMDALPQDLPLGFYECPFPYKRLLSSEVLRFMADSGRFAFVKDTCCDIGTIRERLAILDGSPVNLFNANTATLLDSLDAGGAGYSGVMANFLPDVYDWLCRNHASQPDLAREVQSVLTLCSFTELKGYPNNAKRFLQLEGLSLTTVTRNVAPPLDATNESELRQLRDVADHVRALITAH